MRALSQIKSPDSVNLLGVTKDSDSWLFADDCAVYLYANSNYSLLSLTELRNNFSAYNVTCYYDNATEDGGRVRIVVARSV